MKGNAVPKVFLLVNPLVVIGMVSPPDYLMADPIQNTIKDAIDKTKKT